MHNIDNREMKATPQPGLIPNGFSIYTNRENGRAISPDRQFRV